MNDHAFRPLPLVSNRHLQTVLAMWVKRGRFSVPTLRYIVELRDGDKLVVHENRPSRWAIGDPVAIVVHGLTGSHRSGGVILQALRLFQRGVRTFRLDLRGAGAGFALARKIYNAGCSDDLRAVVELVAKLAHGSPITLVGTSLGGNVALKLAGEAAQWPVPQLARVAALNPPVDLAACTAMIAERRNRAYEMHFVRDLVRNVERRRRVLGEPAPNFPRRLSLQRFDDLYTAPRNGYADAADYYARCSSAPFVTKATAATLIVSSRDDPFVAVEPIEQLGALPNVELNISDRGGHTGFLGHDGRGGWGWAEAVIARWVVGKSMVIR
jgi:predicted alpha/beta-fold hydrolase